MTSSSSTIGRLAVRNTVWLTLLSYAGQLFSFAATIVLTRRLGPQIFGLFAIGTFWSSIVGLRAKSGLNSAAIRQPTLDGELLGTVYALDLSLALGTLILSAFAAAGLLWLGYAPEVGLVVIVSTISGNLDALVAPLGLTLERELQLSRLTLLWFLATIVAYGAGMLLAFSGGGIWSLLVMNVVTSVAAVFAMYWLCKRRLPHIFRLTWRFSGPKARQLLKQGIPVGLSNQGTSVIVNQYDNFLIGTFVGVTTLGFYDRAYRTSQWPNNLLAAALQRVGFVTFSRVQNDLPRLTHAMRLCMWVLTTLGTPMALALIFGASDLIEWLYTPAWSQSAYFLRFLVLYSLLSPFIGLGTSLAFALGNLRTTVLIPAIQALTIVAVATPLTLWLGSTGTVLGVGATIAIGFVLSSRYIFRQLPLSVKSVFGRPLAAALLASLVTLLVFRLPGWSALPLLVRLSATTLSSAGLYIALLFVLAYSEMVERIRYLVKTFRGTGSN
jgi:O-antigen/teichoic acid export membrane protein